MYIFMNGSHPKNIQMELAGVGGKMVLEMVGNLSDLDTKQCLIDWNIYEISQGPWSM